MRSSLLFALLLTSCTCEASTGRPIRPGFDVGEISLCASGTVSASIRTQTGGRLELQILDACGEPVRSCTTPDVYAPSAIATVRASGPEILAEGCVLPAADGATLRAIFHASDASRDAAEQWDVALGSCTDAATPDATCP